MVNQRQKTEIKEKTKTKLSVKFFDLKGVEKKESPLIKEIFDCEINDTLLAQYMRVYLANQRQGTASTKTRGEVDGSTKKIYKQKGTGRARHGDIKAPIFIGGGIALGPKPRDFSLKINKKQGRQALFQSLTLKARQNAIIGIEDDFSKMEPKTKNFASFLKSIDLIDKKILLVVKKIQRNSLTLSVRNLSEINVCEVTAINPYLVLNNNIVLITDEALIFLEKYFLEKK